MATNQVCCGCSENSRKRNYETTGIAHYSYGPDRKPIGPVSKISMSYEKNVSNTRMFKWMPKVKSLYLCSGCQQSLKACLRLFNMSLLRIGGSVRYAYQNVTTIIFVGGYIGDVVRCHIRWYETWLYDKNYGPLDNGALNPWFSYDMAKQRYP